ncbi:MAG TPA: hypothetical protein VM030_04625 [Acidimicrobiales bacterium]|nr:hypothetical protein [Acidimicrobiales bacterium]
MRALLVGVLACVALSGCRPDTVHVAFRPPPGAHYAYRVVVESTTVTSLDGRPDRRSHSRFVLLADHVVLASTETTTTVRVTLKSTGTTSRTLVVRLDRAAQLVEVERIEGVSTDVLGQLGLSEIFPAAVGAPPDRALRPGARWTIDEPLRLADRGEARLRGFGRLSELGVVRGRDVATVESDVRLPVARDRATAGGSRDGSLVELDGTQTTRTRTTHALADGAVESASSHSRAEFALRLRPPVGQPGPELGGTLAVQVTSRTTRLR